MRKQLVPLSKFRNTDILDDRLVMHDFGWPIIPIRSGTKKGILDWPRIKNDRDAIQGWHKTRGGHPLYLSTSLRMEGDWFVIDVDVTDQAAVDALLDRWHAQWPNWFGYCLERNAGGVKLALIGRISEPGQKTPKTIVYEGGHKVEFHLGGTVRHLVLLGQHPDGGQYQFVGDSPLTVKHDDLPEFDFDQLDLLREVTAEILDARFARVADQQSEHAGGKAYDLTPETVFILTDGTELTCAELEKELAGGDELRGILGGRNAWGASSKKDHCNAKLNIFTGILQIHDYADDVTHHYEGSEPEVIAPLSDERRAEMKEALGLITPDIEEDTTIVLPSGFDSIQRFEDPFDTFNAAVDWMLVRLAYWTGAFKGRGGVIGIQADGEGQNPVTVAALRGAFGNYGYTEEGPRGGKKRHNPVDAWMMHPDQVKVAGVRMRPDLGRPLYYEDGLLYVNRYCPPEHPDEGGSAEGLWHRLAALIPADDERAWFVNWLASKAQHPEWRMVGVAMVAQESGTGRGLLAEFLGRLFGERYVAPLPYRQLTGGDGSRFTADFSDRLLVYVEEAKTADDSNFRGKNAGREALKAFIEPNHQLLARIEGKGVDAIYGRISVSTMVFTNHTDGLPIDEDDRRVAVLMNGDQMKPDEVAAFRLWMADPLNIGAAWRALRAFRVEAERSVFDPFMAPPFIGHDIMVDAGKSAIDRAYEAAMGLLAAGAELYCLPQIVRLSRALCPTPGFDFDSIVEKHARAKGIRAAEKKDSPTWRVRYDAVAGAADNRVPVYCVSRSLQRHWSRADLSLVKAELDKAQAIVDSRAPSLPPGLRSIKGGKD